MIITGQRIVDFASLYMKMPFYRATGIGFEDNGLILGGVVFDNFTHDAYGKLQGAEASVIVIDKKCITHYNLVKFFGLPFVDMNIKRLQIRCGRSEKKKRDLILRLGFKYEGIAREAWPFGGDAATFSMLKSECRYLHGIKPQPSGSTRSSHNGSSTNGVERHHSGNPSRA